MSLEIGVKQTAQIPGTASMRRDETGFDGAYVWIPDCIKLIHRVVTVTSLAKITAGSFRSEILVEMYLYIRLYLLSYVSKQAPSSGLRGHPWLLDASEKTS